MDLFEDNGGVADHTFVVEILVSNDIVIATNTYVVLDNTTQNVSFTFVPTTATSTLRITNTYSTNTISSDGKVDNISIVCFADGTMIETIAGPLPVEKLTVGMLIKIQGGDFEPLRLALKRKIGRENLQNKKLRPVCVTAGALGNGLPVTDLFVSRQHGMLVSSKIAKRMFRETDVLVSAIKLTELPGIYVVNSARDIEYFHLVFDDHEIIYATNAPSESFFPGPVAIASLTNEAREELFMLFPELGSGRSPIVHAKFSPTSRQQRKLISRHLKNERPVWDAA